MNCPNCNETVPDKAMFCMMCGTKIERIITCKNCGEELDPKARFCMMCGTKVEKNTICKNCGEELNPKSKFCIMCGASAEDKTETQNIASSNNIPKQVNNNSYLDELKKNPNATILDSARPTEYQGREDLVNVIIADGVTEIGEMAFSGCVNLKSVIIPASVTSIFNAFSFCPNLTTIKLLGDNTEIDDNFYESDNVTIVK